jgi:exosortase H (IPTLxxWG-CTERM-specific)
VSDGGRWWRRPEARFLVLFVGFLVFVFAVVALRPVDEALVVPYTGLIARLAGAILSLLGEDTVVRGCEIASPRFTVVVYNGCNGVVTSLIFAAAVLAYPATWRARLAGLLAGLVAIQVVNQVRIVSLFYVGVFLPRYFNEAHVLVWQSIVILSGVSLWLLWAHRCAGHEGPTR